MSKKYTEEEIRVIAQSSLGKTFGELAKISTDSVSLGDDKKNDDDFNKAYFGHLIETDLFDYDINSNSAPDFEDAGIELKVTPYKKLNDGRLSAKERLVLNIINYMDEYKRSFYNSHFWYKNNKIQIMWYLYEKDKKKEDLRITHELLYTFPEDDLKIIKKDWEFIINKIKSGKAHELSEADTMYLGACTKGANRNSLREQPFSSIKAMQRAFCLKTSYMTQLVRKYIGNYSDVEKVLKNSNLEFEDYFESVCNKYIGKTDIELADIFGMEITGRRKDLHSGIVNAMFNVKGRLRNTDEFLKANIIPKTIRVEEDGNIKESISFPTFKFKEIIKEEWDNSELKEELETTKYMFFIFKKENNNYIFKGFKIWNMPQTTIDTVIKDFWNKTVNIIRNGVEFNIEGNTVYNNLPGMSDNGIMHVRPHSPESAYKLNNGFSRGNINSYADELPNGEWMTKQCFWFNNKFVMDVVKDMV